MTSSIGLNRASSHGAISTAGPGAPSGNSSAATIVCIHVVPHFGGVHTKMSPGRETKRCHRRLSKMMLRYSRSIGRSTASTPTYTSPTTHGTTARTDERQIKTCAGVEVDNVAMADPGSHRLLRSGACRRGA